MTIIGMKPGSFLFLVFLFAFVIYFTGAAFEAMLKIGPVWPLFVGGVIIILFTFLMWLGHHLSKARDQRDRIKHDLGIHD